MFALIKREIQDHLVFFFGVFIFTTFLVLISLPTINHYEIHHSEALMVVLAVPAVIILIISFCAMGFSQMYNDRNRKISAFLTTLPVSRNQILLARIITGTLALLIFFLPLIVTASILLRIYTPPIPIYSDMIFEISLTAFLMAFACYCIGLQAGWNPGKLMHILGGLVLSGFLILLIIIKGFGFEISVILVFFNIAGLIRIRQTFISTPL
jgi:ABC-type transport system involved in multi-copper enzyme maturation permease subunit